MPSGLVVVREGGPPEKTIPYRPHPGLEAPYSYVQWKGTNVCMDVHCTCGATYHVDADFAYALKCMECGQVYEMPTYVALMPVAETFFTPLEMHPEEDYAAPCWAGAGLPCCGGFPTGGT